MNILRSLVFTSLLELSPEFRAMTTDTSSQVITEATEWVRYHDEYLDIFQAVRAFLATKEF